MNGKERGQQMVNNIRAWIGTRWAHQGRFPGERLDCAGVVVCGGRSVGIAVADCHGYPPHPEEFMVPTVEKNCVLVPREEVREGDILVFESDKARIHLGVYSGDGHFIHGHAIARKVAENRMDEKWSKALVSVYRFKELVD